MQEGVPIEDGVPMKAFVFDQNTRLTFFSVHLPKIS
jgi:hypothetical protein